MSNRSSYRGITSTRRRVTEVLPNGIPNLMRWGHAADSLTSGVASTNDQFVSSLVDRISGTSYTNKTDFLYKSAGMNGKPAFFFNDGNANKLIDDTTFSMPSTWTSWVVVSRTAGFNSTASVISMENPQGQNYGRIFQLGWENSTKIRCISFPGATESGANPRVASANIADITSPILIIGVNDTSTTSVYMNNTLLSTNNFPSDAQSARPGTFGIYSVDAGFNGYVAEFGIYSRVLSTSEISTLVNYANNRYGTGVS